jgi:hypothetical protein
MILGLLAEAKTGRREGMVVFSQFKRLIWAEGGVPPLPPFFCVSKVLVFCSLDYFTYMSSRSKRCVTSRGSIISGISSGVGLQGIAIPR